MTDNETIKALECCIQVDCDVCDGCPLYDKESGCLEMDIRIPALDLIKRQKEQIKQKDTEIDILIRKKETLKDELAEKQAEIAELQSELIITKNNFDNAKDRYDEAVKIGQKMNEKLINSYKKLQTAKTEARKGFWERLKAQNTMDERIISVQSGDNLLEEMESERE